MAKESKKTNNEKKNFFKEFKAELKRVSWPTFKQVINNTTAVLAIVLITAAIVFVLDVIFENLNNLGVERLKALVTSSSSESSETDGNNDEVNVESETSNEAGESLVVDGEDANATTEETNTAVSTENTNSVDNQ